MRVPERSATGASCNGTMARSSTPPASTPGWSCITRSRDVGTIGEAERDGRRQAVSCSRLGDEGGEIVGAAAHVGFIEDAFCQTPEEARHAAFQHLTTRREQGGTRRDRPAERQQIVFIAAGAVQQEQRRAAGHGGRLEAMDEGQRVSPGHGTLLLGGSARAEARAGDVGSGEDRQHVLDGRAARLEEGRQLQRLAEARRRLVHGEAGMSVAISNSTWPGSRK